MKEKGGQVTIFIIIAIVVIGAVIVFLLFGTRIGQKIGIAKETNPESFLESCLEEKTKEVIKTISLQGGSINNPLNKSFKFEKELSRDISYLCYNQNDYFPCINQEPLLFRHLEKEIKEGIREDVNNCFDSLETSLKKQGYAVEKELRGFEVKLQPRKVIIETNSELTLTKTGETSKQENFKVTVGSMLYELTGVVQEIINKEATTCEFSNYDMLLYPEFDINKYPTRDSSLIYTVKHEKTNEEFRFAIRGCVIPPGFGLEFE